jgi:hypothetical protein
MGGTTSFAELLMASQAELRLSSDAFAELLRVDPDTLANWKLCITFPTFAERLAAIDRIEAEVGRQPYDAEGI